MDVFSFVRQGKTVQGVVRFAELARFAAGLPGQGEAALQWSVAGELGQRGALWLHLRLTGAPVLECQRCLAPFAWPLDARVTLQVVASEAEIDADGGATLDDAALAAPEKVLGSARFDLLALIEDELILALPVAPRHVVCPQPLVQAAPAAAVVDDAVVAVAPRPSPFAALAGLAVGKPQPGKPQLAKPHPGKPQKPSLKH